MGAYDTAMQPINPDKQAGEDYIARLDSESSKRHLRRVDELEYVINRSIATLTGISATLKTIVDRQERDEPIGETDLEALYGVGYLIDDEIEKLKTAWDAKQ